MIGGEQETVGSDLEQRAEQGGGVKVPAGGEMEVLPQAFLWTPVKSHGREVGESLLGPLHGEGQQFAPVADDDLQGREQIEQATEDKT